MNNMTSPPRLMSAHNTLHALLFQAVSAEYIALCWQAFQLARHALRERLQQGTFRSPAVIFDLDETLLDNSAYAAWQIQAGTNFDEASSWRAWCNAAQSEAVPAAVEYVHYVRESKATPFFVTSRENVTRRATVENLRKLGIIGDKEADRELELINDNECAVHTHVFMKGMATYPKTTPSGTQQYPLPNKFSQRVFIQQVRGFEIILSLGDQLADYAEYYGRVTDENGNAISGAFPTPLCRRKSVLQDLSLFGRDFILIPNATYGGWLRAFEANRLGSSDELAATGAKVRQDLVEPSEDFYYENPKFGTTPSEPELKVARPLGPKFKSSELLRIWEGPDLK
jgi:predicted secreted acid phosphatase